MKFTILQDGELERSDSTRIQSGRFENDDSDLSGIKLDASHPGVNINRKRYRYFHSKLHSA